MAEHALELLCHGYTCTNSALPLAPWRGGWEVRLAHDDDVDVVGGTLEEDVADISAYDIAFDAQAVGSLAYLVEYGLVEDFGQFFIGI